MDVCMRMEVNVCMRMEVNVCMRMEVNVCMRMEVNENEQAKISAITPLLQMERRWIAKRIMRSNDE